MNKNRKIFLVLLLTLALLFMAACTSASPEPQTEPEPQAEPEPQTEPVPQPEPDPLEAYNAAAEAAFRVALQTYVDLGTLPGDEEGVPYSEYADGDWSDRYAILDVDGDGRDELVWRVAQTIMACVQENIYAYDEETGELSQEMGACPVCQYYRDGQAVTSGWSHATGMEGPDFWPFNVYVYNAETDAYEFIGYCAQASLEAMKQMGWEERFPAEADLDGDGIVYEISNETTGNLDWVDEDGYRFWFENIFGTQGPMEMPWNSLDEFLHPNG